MRCQPTSVVVISPVLSTALTCPAPTRTSEAIRDAATPVPSKIARPALGWQLVQDV
jgi:hypothetical protein